jgi:hypothetical protein
MNSELAQVEVFAIPLWPWIGLALLGAVGLALIISLIVFRKK